MKLSSGVKVVLGLAAAAAVTAMAVLVAAGLVHAPREQGAWQDGRVAPHAEPVLDAQPGPSPTPAALPAATTPEQVPVLLETVESAPPDPEPQAETEDEDFGSLDVVILRNCYPPRGEPVVTVEYFRGGGLSITVRSPGVVSLKAEYGLPLAKRAVRLCGLDGRQLARVRQFERKFRYTVDARMAKEYKNVELTAAEISNAVTNKLWVDYRRRLDKLDRQMKEIHGQWRELYREYVGGIGPILTEEQRLQVRAAVLGEHIDVP